MTLAGFISFVTEEEEDVYSEHQVNHTGYEKIEIGDEENKGSDEKTKLLVIGSGTV
jgi:hypothetical protein